MVTMTRRHDGKKYSIIAGRPKGEDTLTEQAYRYDKDTWTVETARTHCKDHDGAFEAAAPAKKIDVVVVDDRQLLVLGAPYGGHICKEGICKDSYGEYFSPKTDFMVGIGDERPVIYYHGADEKIPHAIGIAKVEKRDERGLWFNVKLGLCKFANKVWEAAGRGIAKASTGTVQHLIRIAKDGEILTWPIAELTLFDESFIRQPANQLAVVELRALFDEIDLQMPEGFAEADSVEEDDSADFREEFIRIAASATAEAVGALKSHARGGS